MRSIRVPTVAEEREHSNEPPFAPVSVLRDVRINWNRFLTRAAIALATTILLCLGVSYIMLLRGGSVRIQQSDLLVYYSASRLVLHGHGGAIYDFPVLKSVEASMFHSLLLIRSEAVFLYPPFVALVLAPLAATGYGTAYLLWFLLNCALLAGVLVALRRYLNLRRSGALLLAAAGASFFPVFATLAQGQISIVLLAVIAASFLALRSGREVLSGGLLAIALIKPPYVIPFLFLLLVQRRWRALAGFSAVAAALALVPMAFLGTAINQQYIHLLRVATGWHTTSGGFSPRANQDFAGFFHLLLAPSLATALQGLCSVGALATVFVVARRRSAVEIPFAIATVAALLVNPHVLIHDLSLLLIPAAIALRHSPTGAKALPALLTGGYLAILAGVPLSTAIPVQLPVLAMTALLLWLVRTGVGSQTGNRAYPLAVAPAGVKLVVE